jgi:hypothetical protein
VLPSGHTLTLGLLATMALTVLSSSQCYYHLLNASWKLHSVSVFSTACNSALINSNVSKWRLFSFIFNRGNRKVGWVMVDSHVVFGKKIPWWKMKHETVCCPDATDSSFAAKVQDEIQSFWGRCQSQQYLSNVFYYYYIPTTCFVPYGPSSGGISVVAKMLLRN